MWHPRILSVLIGGFTGFVACLVGWQINLLAMHQGLERRSKTAAFLVGMGATVADLVFLLVVFTGLFPFMNHPERWAYLKWVSVGMLSLVGVRTLLKKKFSVLHYPQTPKRRNPGKSFLLGFIVVVTNPLVLILWIAVISFLVAHFPDAAILGNKIPFMAAFGFGGMIWFSFLTFFVLHHAKKWDEARLHLISRIFSIGIILGAIVILFAKF